MHVIGTTKNRSWRKVKRLIAKNNLTKNIVFLGERNDINEIMLKSKVVIVPSRSEGLGRTMIEAMHCGCLVIGNAEAEGLREQFDNGLKITGKEIGLRYSGNNELVEALNLVMKNGIQYYYPTIELAHQVVYDLYSIDRNVNETIAFYNFIINDNML